VVAKWRQKAHGREDWRGWWEVNFLLFLVPRKFRKFRKFTGDIGRSLMSALLSRRVLAPRMERTVEDGGPQSTSNP
jgi:hypothetical protein